MKTLPKWSLSLILTHLFFLYPHQLRGVPPNIGPTPPLDFRPYKADRLTLKNGLTVFVLEDHELPLFQMKLFMKTSPMDVPEERQDVFSFFSSQWLAGGTKSRTPDQLNQELEHHAIDLGTSASHESATIEVSCLKKVQDQALDIFMDVLFHPEFRGEQLALAKLQFMEDYRRRNETPRDIGRRAFRDLIYGRDHIYAHNSSPASVRKVKRSDLLTLHKKVVVPNFGTLAVCGDFKKEEIWEDLEKRFSGWTKSNRTLAPPDYGLRSPPTGALFYVEKISNQSRVQIGRLGVPRHHPDHYSLSLAGTILGGPGAARLFGEIRSRLGLAYIVGSFVTEPAGPGMIGVLCETKPSATLQVVRALQRELDKFSEGPISEEEIKNAKDQIINSYIFRFNSRPGVVKEEAESEFLGYSPDYLETYPQKIKNVSAAEIQKAATKYFSRDGMKVLVVGDKKKFEEPLTSLGEVTQIPLKDVD